MTTLVIFNDKTWYIQWEHFIYSMTTLDIFNDNTWYIQSQHLICSITTLDIFNDNTWYIQWQHLIYAITTLDIFNDSTWYNQLLPCLQKHTMPCRASPAPWSQAEVKASASRIPGCYRGEHVDSLVHFQKYRMLLIEIYESRNHPFQWSRSGLSFSYLKTNYMSLGATPHNWKIDYNRNSNRKI